MKDCKKLRKRYRRKVLSIMYAYYIVMCDNWNVTRKYFTFKSYIRGFRKINTVKLLKRFQLLKFVNYAKH